MKNYKSKRLERYIFFLKSYEAGSEKKHYNTAGFQEVIYFAKQLELIF